MGTLDVVRVEDGGKEQQEQHTVDDDRERVEEARVHHQYDKTETDTRANPQDLHTRACVEREQIVVADGVARAAEALPSEEHQCYVQANGQPVDLRPNALWFVVYHYF